MPTLNGPNKPKTSGKLLRIADLQWPASGQNKPDTLIVDRIINSVKSFHAVLAGTFINHQPWRHNLSATLQLIVAESPVDRVMYDCMCSVLSNM